MKTVTEFSGSFFERPRASGAPTGPSLPRPSRPPSSPPASNRQVAEQPVDVAAAGDETAAAADLPIDAGPPADAAAGSEENCGGGGRVAVGRGRTGRCCGLRQRGRGGRRGPVGRNGSRCRLVRRACFRGGFRGRPAPSRLPKPRPPRTKAPTRRDRLSKRSCRFRAIGWRACLRPSRSFATGPTMCV